MKREKEDLLNLKTDFRTIRQSAVISVIIQGIFRLKGLITLPILTYYLLPCELGTYSLILITASMLTPLFSMNLTDGPAIHLVLEKSKIRLHDMYNTVLNSNIIFFCLYAPLFWLLMPSSEKISQKEKALVLMLIFSEIIYKNSSYIFAVFQKTPILLKNTLIKDGLSSALMIILVIFGFSYGGMIVAMVLSGIFAATILFKSTRVDLPYRFFISRSILVKFLKTSLPLLPVFFFSWIVQSSASYFIAYYMNNNEVGKYSVVFSLANVILTLTFALNFFWFPVSAKLWVEDREKYRLAFRYMFAGSATLLLVAITMFELDSGIIMNLLARQKEYQGAHIIMGIMAFGFSMQVLITILTAPLYSSLNTLAIFLSYLAGGCINVTLNLFLIPDYGLLGAAISMAVSYFAIMMAMMLLNYQVAKFTFFDKRLIGVVMVFLSTWLGAAYFRELLSVYQILLLNLVFIGATGLFLYCGILKKYEIVYLKSLIKSLATRKVANLNG